MPLSLDVVHAILGEACVRIQAPARPSIAGRSRLLNPPFAQNPGEKCGLRLIDALNIC